jgi:uncharacterized membrane protein YjdF
MTRAVSDSFAHRALLGLSLTFVALGIAPVDRQSWFVENIMVLLVSPHCGASAADRRCPAAPGAQPCCSC